MKLIDEYRDPELARRLVGAMRVRADQAGRGVTIMEVCGSHTYAIGRHGIRGLLPEGIRLVSGPGCPVCVTSVHDIDVALYVAGLKGVIFVTFGDMLRVPGTGGSSLQKVRAAGADVRIVASASECIPIAQANPGKEVVFMGIGFETTTPTIASMVRTCRAKGIANVSVVSVHKVIPPAIRALLDDPDLAVDAFLCPGHVSTILGARAYDEIVQRGRAAVIAGFEPVDILEGIYLILGQIVKGEFSVEIQYRRGVSPQGNPRARALIDEVFEPVDAEWRGLGTIPGSGLSFREEYRGFDALKRFEVPLIQSREEKACRCGDILKGRIDPPGCPLFRTVCTPDNPVGPCMVTHEGTCSTYYICC
ncbi:MAG TPA: hydrogenase formation protein HypD [Deltaproteobacteria bacterium]|jgi:hydrogenase expression/formation protein HypD|nr:hydrogenase formation protein HypD [Deltaproteobacteria bacterium]HOI08632.1 hydrogenase formation protein HypD [Deltaproteobacteria bacterium]